MIKGQIIAMGGGGFSMEKSPALDQYILDQANAARPSVAFLGQASGDSPVYQLKFYAAMTKLNCQPSHLSLFEPHTADVEAYLMAQDVIYVGGGNTKSMLALWREWGLDHILRQACESGIVLAGISAGAICWFEQGLTDSIPGPYRGLPCLGYLPGSCSPHYDGEAQRRPRYQHLIGTGEIMGGHAFDDSAAGHFVDGVLKTCIASRKGASAYHVVKGTDGAIETPLAMQLLD